MVPVDLAHRAALGKALACAVDLAGHYRAEIVYVGVTASTPGATAHNPQEYQAKLDAFAAEQTRDTGITARADMVLSHDPSADLDEKLLAAITRTGADLVVMQSHLPNVLDHFWPSNGGRVAEHAHCSVLVVRD